MSAIGPTLGSSLDSNTTPLALFLGLDFNSKISAVIKIVSNKLSKLIFVLQKLQQILHLLPILQKQVHVP